MVAIIIGFLFFIFLIPATKKYVDLGHQTFGFPKKTPLMYLIPAIFLALFGLMFLFISESLGEFILISSAVYAGVVVTMFFLYSIVGFFKSN